MKLHSLALIGAITAFGTVAQAATLTFDFTNLYAPGVVPNGTGPFATAVLSDVGANTVNLVLTHNASSAVPQYVSMLRLNVEPGVGAITTTAIGGKTTAFDGTALDSGVDAGTSFDFRIDFGTSNAGGGINRLNSGDSITLQMVGTGLSVANFDAWSSGGTPTQALLHLQGITTDTGTTSAKLGGEAVPEPATIAVLAGLGFIAARRKRK